ncbi:MAG TPA: peptidase MA family metallohydrolase, partial [Thermodesulfobacteriota bacterium]
FTVSFEGGGTSEQAGYLVSLLLEEAYHAVGRRLEAYPDEPVHAVLYPRERFRDVTRSPDWAGAIYDGKIRLPIGGLTDRTEALRRVIAHEYTHALVHRLSRGRAPVWLNEGLAQLGEDAGIEAARDRFLAHVRAGGPVVSLRRLEGSFMGLGAAEAELAYLEALTATDFLVARYGPAASRRILDRLGAGAPLAAAIEEVLSVSYEEFERQWMARYR